jgi:type I restriction enzyme M protein
VPDGVLFGTSNAHTEMRRKLVEENRLDAVVSMPSGVFRPYAGVSTAVVVFTKGAATEKIWFYDMEHDGFSLDDKRQRASENDIPDILDCWNNRHEPKFATKRTQRLAELRKKIEPLKALRLKLLAEVNRLTFEHAIAGEENGDKAFAALEVDQQKLESLHDQLEPLQTEINQLTRQFWVSKEQVKANKYELSASRYRQVEQDQEFYEHPRVTLERLRQLETVSTSAVATLKAMLAKS